MTDFADLGCGGFSGGFTSSLSETEGWREGMVGFKGGVDVALELEGAVLELAAPFAAAGAA